MKNKQVLIQDLTLLRTEYSEYVRANIGFGGSYVDKMRNKIETLELILKYYPEDETNN